jgi:adhesin/invasin
MRPCGRHTAGAHQVALGQRLTLDITELEPPFDLVAQDAIFGYQMSKKGKKRKKPLTDHLRACVTDTNGQARVTFIAGTTTGEETIQAQIATAATATTNTLRATTSVSVASDSIAASDIKLLVSSPQMNSDGSETVTLTALVRDMNDNLLSGVDVTFRTVLSSSAAIQVTRGTTDTTGTAEALLTTGGDFSNRVIELEAKAGSLTDRNSVVVSGTTITISGTNSLVAGETTTLSLLLQDSTGTGIANRDITMSSTDSSKAILIDPGPEPESVPMPSTSATATTDSNGNAKVDLIAMGPDTDTIQASALGANATFTLNVSSEQFKLTTDKVEIKLFDNDNGTDTDVGQVSLMWDPARQVNFFISRGLLHVGDPDSPPASPDDEGSSVSVLTVPPTPPDDTVATVFVTSDSAGSATIRAAAADDPNGPSSEIEIEFVATKAHSLVLQASPSTLGINLGGATDQQSIITAIVRDPNNNLVKNKTVSFNLIDVSGGTISPPSATTDSFGRASTVYTAGPTPSAQDGVIIDAEVTTDIGDTPCGRDIDAVPISGPCNQVPLTVAQQSLAITLGNGNEIVVPNTTVFHMPFVVLVTDANSNPVPNTTVELNLIPLRYRTGTLFQIFIDGNFEEWGRDIDDTCPNEDLLTGDSSKDRNGILDDDGTCSGEDANCNGILDPGNVASVPGTVTTDANGFAEFNVEYPQNHNHWVEVELEARTTVAGSESSTTMSFFLEGLASDFETEPPPPGVTSPFGTGPCN